MPVPKNNPQDVPADGFTASPEVVVVHLPESGSTVPEQGVVPTLGEVLLERDDKTNKSVATPQVDRVQKEVMTAISPDGRPPNRQFVLAEWKWLVVGAIVLSACWLVWAATSRLPRSTIIFSAAVLCMLVGAGAPVWWAGVLRGREEREARKVALLKAERDRRF